MNENLRPDEVVAAARRLGSPEFTREDIAKELGVQRSEIRDSFKTARQAGHFERTRSDPDGTRYFRLAGAGDADEGHADEE